MKLIFITFLTCCLIQCFYYIVFLKNLWFRSKPKIIKEGQKGVSVIVCAKNEAKALKKNIPYWLNQDYPSFELLIVNDNSTDHTSEILNQYESNERVRILTLSQNTIESGKREALKYGIKNAKYERLLLTDADCIPSSNAWISTMTSAMKDHQIVLGVGIYLNNEHAILSNVIHYETTLAYLQYLTAASIGIPYGGVGRNLLYDKNLFKNKFPELNTKLISGDDDLWLKELANSKNTKICIDVGSTTLSMPPDNWKNWLKQKRRHYSTGRYYRNSTKLYTSTFLASKILFYVLFLLLLFMSNASMLALLIPFITTIAIIFLTTCAVQNRIEQRCQKISIPFLDFLIIFLMVFVGIFATFRPPKKWK